jgi:hypothetical protein
LDSLLCFPGNLLRENWKRNHWRSKSYAATKMNPV